MDSIKAQLLKLPILSPGSPSLSASQTGSRNSYTPRILLDSVQAFAHGSIHPHLPRHFTNTLLNCSIVLDERSIGKRHRKVYLQIQSIRIPITSAMDLKPSYTAVESLRKKHRDNLQESVGIQRDVRSRSFGSIVSPTRGRNSEAEVRWILALVDQDKEFVEIEFMDEEAFLRCYHRLGEVLCRMTINKALRLTKGGFLSLPKIEEAIAKCLLMTPTFPLLGNSSDAPIDSMVASIQREIRHALKIFHLKRDLNEVFHLLSHNLYSVSKEDLEMFVLRLEQEAVIVMDRQYLDLKEKLPTALPRKELERMFPSLQLQSIPVRSESSAPHPDPPSASRDDSLKGRTESTESSDFSAIPLQPVSANYSSEASFVGRLLSRVRRHLHNLDHSRKGFISKEVSNDQSRADSPASTVKPFPSLEGVEGMNSDRPLYPEDLPRWRTLFERLQSCQDPAKRRTVLDEISRMLSAFESQFETNAAALKEDPTVTIREARPEFVESVAVSREEMEAISTIIEKLSLLISSRSFSPADKLSLEGEIENKANMERETEELTSNLKKEASCACNESSEDGSELVEEKTETRAILEEESRTVGDASEYQKEGCCLEAVLLRNSQPSSFFVSQPRSDSFRPSSIPPGAKENICTGDDSRDPQEFRQSLPDPMVVKSKDITYSVNQKLLLSSTSLFQRSFEDFLVTTVTAATTTAELFTDMEVAVGPVGAAAAESSSDGEDSEVLSQSQSTPRAKSTSFIDNSDSALEPPSPLDSLHAGKAQARQVVNHRPLFWRPHSDSEHAPKSPSATDTRRFPSFSAGMRAIAQAHDGSFRLGNESLGSISSQNNSSFLFSSSLSRNSDNQEGRQSIAGSDHGEAWIVTDSSDLKKVIDHYQAVFRSPVSLAEQAAFPRPITPQFIPSPESEKKMTRNPKPDSLEDSIDRLVSSLGTNTRAGESSSIVTRGRLGPKKKGRKWSRGQGVVIISIILAMIALGWLGLTFISGRGKGQVRIPFEGEDLLRDSNAAQNTALPMKQRVVLHLDPKESEGEVSSCGSDPPFPNSSLPTVETKTELPTCDNSTADSVNFEEIQRPSQSEVLEEHLASPVVSTEYSDHVAEEVVVARVRRRGLVSRVKSGIGATLQHFVQVVRALFRVIIRAARFRPVSTKSQ